MEKLFPETVYVSVCGSEGDQYLGVAETEIEAVKATDDEEKAQVAEYKLVSIRNLTIVTSVRDAD